SGMRLMTYLVSEFLHMVTAAVLIVLLFLGGWHFWGLTSSCSVSGRSKGSLAASAVTATKNTTNVKGCRTIFHTPVWACWSTIWSSRRLPA
ncbi:MAG: NADH-quinone oxidoreductase subunit H, partial [Clostridia bacterium]|nr:NADH-quinone oxidoreductase subunit H [Clostridia bacterium]